MEEWYTLVDTIIIETPYKKIAFESESFPAIDEEKFDYVVNHLTYEDLLKVAQQVRKQILNDSILIEIKGCSMIRISEVRFVDISMSTHPLSESFFEREFYQATKKEAIELIESLEQ